MRKVLALGLAVILCMSLLAGCTKKGTESSGTTSKNVKVVFIPKLTGNSFFESANLGAQDIATKVGFECKYDGSPEASVANQVQIINSAVQQGADALAISSLSVDGLNTALKAAADAGVKIVCWDSDVNNKYRSLHVAQGTPTQLGEMLVEMAASQLPAGKTDAKYVFHYSSPTVTDQNSWVVAAKEYIAKKYPNWVAVADPQYSEQDAEKAITVGEAILDTYKDIDIILCPDSTALPGQAQAAKNKGKAGKVIITGFATPNSMRDYCKDGTVAKFGLWDCKIQGAMGAYLGYWLAAGNTFKVGDTISIPDVGDVKVEPNTVLDPNAYTADNSGVVLLPERVVFSKDNIDKYNF